MVGLELANGARLVAQGTPDRPIRFVPFPVVQEQQLNWGNAPVPYLICGPTHAGVVSPPPPSLTLRFVQFSQPAANGWGCFSQTDWYAFTAQDVRDCQFLNGWNQFWGPWAVANTIEVRNNLFQRSPASFVGCQTLSLYNNLFWGGSNYFKSHQVGFWTIRDNAFQNTVLRDDSAAGWVSNSHNAYLGAGQAQLQNSGGYDVVTNTFAYVAGPYGPWYQASTSLVDRGSQSASAAGLYHETTQADQTRETNSTVDIGFHYIPIDPETGEALDSDHDGLADYVEDWDGDGLTGPNDTDPSNPDTNGNGRLDGEERAGYPGFWNKSYECTNLLDFTQPSTGRNPKYPDTEYRIGWGGLSTCWADLDCRFGECLPPDPPPETVVGQHREQRWSNLICNGTERLWSTNVAGQVTGGDPMIFTAYPPILREKCGDYFGGDFFYTESGVVGATPMTVTVRRRAETDVRLSASGSTWPKPLRSVRVHVDAVDKTDGQSLGVWDTGCGSGEPNTRWVGQAIDPAIRSVVLNDRQTDADGDLLLQVPRAAWDYRLRPAIACQWFQYDVAVRPHQIVRMTWSRHPQVVPARNVQDVFDEGARILAYDDDARIRDNDPRVVLNSTNFNQNLYNADDAPTYMEFIVIKARSSVFKSGFDTSGYKDITDPAKLDSLRIDQFANVKIVASITIVGVPFCGAALPGLPSLVLANTQLDGLTVAHEFGHTAGLVHRGYTGNPGATNDTTAVMHEDHSGGQEVNRHERDSFLLWNLPLWNN